MTRAIILGALILGGAALAQESANFKLNEHVFNAGGVPRDGQVLTSTTFRITLMSVGVGPEEVSLTSVSFNMDSGFGSAYPPPGEVTGLRFTAPDTLEWDPEKSAGVYNLYRDTISNVAGLGFGNCQQQDLADPMAVDGDPVPADDGFFYLATVESRLAEEGTKGSLSDGAEREGTVCP